MPTRSISSKGPIRKPPPTRQIRSTCSGVAMPSCTMRSASAPNGRPQRFTRKPGPSAATITRRPIASPVAVAIPSARSPVCSAGITSSSFISGGGLKKCMPTTCSGRAAAPAREVIGIEEVLVARTVSTPQTFDSSEKRPRLRSARSGAASITSSHPARSSSEAAGVTSAPASLGSRSRRPFSASLCRPLCNPTMPFSRAVPSGSWRRVSIPAAAPSWAMPDPIVPAPTTPRTFGGELTGVRPLGARPACASRRRAPRLRP